MDSNGASAVILDGVSKSFDGVRAVQGLSAQVPRGTIYGFLGPNGAGKTTTIRMIMDILRPDGGRIEVLGAASARQAKDRVGYMPEERGLYPRMKVRNVLAFLAELKGVPKTEIPGRIESWLKAMDLSGWRQKEVRELSRGMQRRLEFIAAVISDPELIVMDEPFAGLDPLNLDLVKNTILRMRAAGKTIILSTHIMEQAETLCDRILLIHRGEKVLDGSLDEIRAPYESDAVVVEVEGEGPSRMSGLSRTAASSSRCRWCAASRARSGGSPSPCAKRGATRSCWRRSSAGSACAPSRSRPLRSTRSSSAWRGNAMNKMLVIARREYKEVLRTKMFWISSLLPIVIMVVAMVWGSRQITPKNARELAQLHSVSRAMGAFIYFFVMFISMMTPSQMLLTSLIEEKSSRVIEVLLSAVSPLELMAGKILGLSAWA